MTDVHQSSKVDIMFVSLCFQNNLLFAPTERELDKRKRELWKGREKKERSAEKEIEMRRGRDRNEERQTCEERKRERDRHVKRERDMTDLLFFEFTSPVTIFL